MGLSRTPVISAQQIADRVTELAMEISTDYEDKEILALVILRGSFIFAADLLRRVNVPIKVDFVRAKSYDGMESTGEVEVTVLPEEPVKERHVLIIEDILDTGLTSTRVREWVETQTPASVAVCTLLDKNARRKVNVEAEYVGFTIGDQFVVGYGLDCDEEHRALPAIHVIL